MNQTFECFFNVRGASTSKKISGSLNVKNLNPIFKLDIGNNLIDNNFNTYAIQGTVGILRDNIDGQNVVIPNVGVYFFKDTISDFHNYSQHEKVNHLHTYPIYDFCQTDINGQYRVFLEPGIYTIKVEGGSYNTFFYNQEFTIGLNNLYNLKASNFTIKSKYDDIIEINNSTKKIISGKFLNNYKKPLQDVEIIISRNNEVISYSKSEKDGKYQFIIDNGIYDVRIRCDKYTMKKIENFNFTNGFMSQLKDQYNWFEEEDWITYI